MQTYPQCAQYRCTLICDYVVQALLHNRFLSASETRTHGYTGTRIYNTDRPNTVLADCCVKFLLKFSFITQTCKLRILYIFTIYIYIVRTHTAFILNIDELFL